MIGITYGTYDLFHYGHMNLLLNCKTKCDYLIVAVSTDEFNAIKGKKSLFSYEQRKEWIENLKCVDLVIPENDWDQKRRDVDEYNIGLIMMGSDWEGKFDDLGVDTYYFPRTEHVSSTQLKGLVKNG